MLKKFRVARFFAAGWLFSTSPNNKKISKFCRVLPSEEIIIEQKQSTLKRFAALQNLTTGNSAL